MPKFINLVYSQPPRGGSNEEDFNRWYDAHRYEMLSSIRGFAAVQRFRLRVAVTNPEAPLPYDYLALAELSEDPDEVMAEMGRRGLNSRESYIEFKKTDTSGPPLPDWWDEVVFASWNGVAIGDRVTSRVNRGSTDDPDDLYLVFSQPPSGPGEDDEFNTWYDEHLYEILEIPGYVAAQRFRLKPAVEDPNAPSPYRYLAVFEVNRGPDELAAEMTRMGLNSRESYLELKGTTDSGPPLPPWWDQVRFAAWNAVALGSRATAE